MKNIRIFYLIFFFHFVMVKFSVYLNRRVVVMVYHIPLKGLVSIIKLMICKYAFSCGFCVICKGLTRF